MTAGLAACGNSGSTTTDGSPRRGDSSASTDGATDENGGDAAGSEWLLSTDVADDAEPGKTDDRAFKKFDEVVEITFGQQVDPVDTTLPENDSVDNNQYTRYLEENFNIKYVMEWTAGNVSDFRQKLSSALPSASAGQRDRAGQKLPCAGGPRRPPRRSLAGLQRVFLEAGQADRGDDGRRQRYIPSGR